MRLKPTGIAKCYGSLAYTETNIRIIVLEYASKGSLVEFFELPVPMATNDYRQLWERLLDLFEGLYVLHNIDHNDSKSLTGYVHHTTTVPIALHMQSNYVMDPPGYSARQHTGISRRNRVSVRRLLQACRLRFN